MRTNPTTIRRGPIIAALIVIAIMLGSALAGISAAQAQPVAASAPSITKGYTACGAEATGKDRTQGGKLVTAKLDRQFVGPDGYWHTCQPWVPDGGDPAQPEPKLPPPDCAARDTYEVWEVKGVMCTSIPPGASTSSTMMLRQTPLGRVRLIASDKSWTAMGKATYGHAVFRCVAAADGSSRWHLEGADCRWAND